MTFKQKLNEGQIVELNGRDYRIDGGALVPVVERGPLGGFVKRLGDCITNEIVAYQGFSEDLYNGLSSNTMVETNVPPRPTFTPTTAGEAAKLPDIVGRWVAVKIDDNDLTWIRSQGATFCYQDKILLIEGADLP